MDEFLNAVFDKRFQFGVPLGSDGTVSVWGTEDFCWKCGAETLVVARIEIRFGPSMAYFPLAAFGGYPELADILLRSLPDDLGNGPIKYRSSKTMNARYLSNGCAHCGALYGDHFAFVLNSDARALHSIPIRIDSAWKQAIEDAWTEKWVVYESRPGHDGRDLRGGDCS